MKLQMLRSAGLSLISCLAWSAFAHANDTQPLISTDPDGTTTTLISSGEALDVTIQDARGVTTVLRYNAQGQLLFEDAPERGVVSFDYDDLQRPESFTTEGGVTSRMQYDEKNRVTKQVWRENGTERIATRYFYDDCVNGEDKVCRIRHNGHTVNYGYSPDGQLASIRTRIADEDAVEALRYSYDDSGRASAMRYPSGLKVAYQYDTEGRVEKLTGVYETGEDRERFTIIKAIAYDEAGRVKSFMHGNGIRTVYKYDDTGRLKRITRKREGVVIGNDRYSYDVDGRIDGITRLNSNHSRQYGYDEQGRLVSESHGDGTPDNSTSISYSYDEVGNRLSRTVDGSARNYNYAPDANRLTQLGQQDLAYDARGNLVEDRKGARNFSYDLTNRMSAFYRDGELRAEYDYDARGRRIRKRLHRANSDGTKSVRFLYDTDGRLVSETARRSDRSAVRARDLVWLGPIAVAQVDRRVKADGSTRRADVLFLQSDHLGAPRTATDESGRAVWHWYGDAFGAKAGNTPAVDRDPDGDGQKTEVSLRFPGQYHDRESGLWYNHNRDYDAKLGRYVQSDPIGLRGGINRYAYVGGDPVQWVDPNGLQRYCVQTSGGVSRDTGGDWVTGVGTGVRVSFSRQYCFDIPRPGTYPTTPVTIPAAPVTPTSTPTPPPEPKKKKEKKDCTPEDDAVADAVRGAFSNPNSNLNEHGGLIVRMPDGSITTIAAPAGATFVPGTNPTVDIFNVTVPAGATVLGGYHTHPSGSVVGSDGYAYSSGQYFSPDDFLIASPGRAFIGSPYGPIYGSVPNSYIPQWNGLILGTNAGSNIQVFALPNGSATGNIPTNSSAALRTLMEQHAIDISACGSTP